MKANTIFLKNILIYIQMYFIGPLIWGGWMVYKLKILTLKEYGHCVLSPVMMIIFCSYFTINIFYMKSLLGRISEPQAALNRKASLLSYGTALKVHCLSILSFGTICTAICMSLLSTNYFSYIDINLNGWLFKAVIGSLSGTSLVFLFYTFFSAIIFTNIAGLSKETHPLEVRKTLINLKYFNLTVYIAGLILFISTAAASFVIINFNYNGNVVQPKEVVLFGLMTAFPVVMSGLLYLKSVKRINSSIIPLEGNQVKTKANLNNEVKNVVQLVFLCVFIILLLIGKIKAWLFILITGFLASLLVGRIYCGWCCPVNTINRLMNILCRQFGIKKTPLPLCLKNQYIGAIFFTFLLCAFIFSIWFEKRFQLFTILTILGIFVSVILTSSFWCNHLCPWGAIFRITSKYSLLNWIVKKDECKK